MLGLAFTFVSPFEATDSSLSLSLSSPSLTGFFVYLVPLRANKEDFSLGLAFAFVSPFAATDSSLSLSLSSP